jgi:hypothetical protein
VVTPVHTGFVGSRLKLSLGDELEHDTSNGWLSVRVALFADQWQRYLFVPSMIPFSQRCGQGLIAQGIEPILRKVRPANVASE